MYKVIIVDDEIEIREGLRSAFPWMELGEFDVHTAVDSYTAMSLVAQIQPDIIITDVKMSGMSGLDMIHALQDQNLFRGKAIIISGFDDFEYIRMAMQNGAVDYILKPINVEELKGILMKSISQINDERTLDMNLKRLEARVNKALPGMREETMRELIKEPYNSAVEAKVSCELKSMNLGWVMIDHYLVFVVEVDDLKAYKQNELILFAVGNVMEQTLEEEHSTFTIFKDRQERWVVILSLKGAPDYKSNMENLLQRIISHINTYVKVAVTIGFHERFIDIKQLYEVYCKAASYLTGKTIHGGNRLLTGEDLKAGEQAEMKLDNMNELLELVQFGTVEEIRAELNGYTGLVYSWSLTSVREIQEHSFEWLLELLNTCADRGIRDRWWEKEIITVWEEFERHDTLGSMQLVIEKYLLKLAETLKKQVSVKSQIVQEAEHYLLKHYQDNLSLQLVADQVHVTPVWLSKLFKKEKQMTFLDYLTYIRIEKAKELLGDTGYRIYQIANEVGYGDRVHFAKTFKKIVGKTPKDYRNDMGIDDE